MFRVFGCCFFFCVIHFKKKKYYYSSSENVSLNDFYGHAFNRDIWTLIGDYAYGTFAWHFFPQLSIADNDPILPHDLGHPNRMDFGVNDGILFPLSRIQLVVFQKCSSY
jgi:hypothetical protein